MCDWISAAECTWKVWLSVRWVFSGSRDKNAVVVLILFWRHFHLILLDTRHAFRPFLPLHMFLVRILANAVQRFSLLRVPTVCLHDVVHTSRAGTFVSPARSTRKNAVEPCGRRVYPEFMSTNNSYPLTVCVLEKYWR